MEEIKLKKFLKFGCGGSIALFVIFVVLVIFIGGNESEKNKENVNKEVDTTEADVKEEIKVDANVKDAEIYKNEIVIHLDAFQDEYDKHWTNNWVTTFEGVSNGTVDQYAAYKTLNSLEKYYTGLGNKIRNTELPELSKDNQKLLKDYISDFQSAVLTRTGAASRSS